MSHHDVLDVKGVAVECLLYNSSAINTIPTVLFFHGTPGTCTHGEVYCCELIEAGIPVISWSRPGYGNTKLTDDIASYHNQAILAIDILKKFSITKAILYATSGGTPIAVEVCRLSPERVLAAIIESSVISRYDLGNRSTYQKLSDQLIFSGVGQYAYDRLHRLTPYLFNLLTLYRYSDLSTRQIMYEAGLMNHDPVIRNRLRLMMDSISNYKNIRVGYYNDINELRITRLKSIGYVPDRMLVIHGSSDSETALKESDYVKAANQNCQYEEIINGSHILPLCSRHRYVSALKLKFINEVIYNDK